ncbi:MULTISPECIES: NAD(P)/FAD-dependent oxidoreductase [unclassified Streptomyces]|uniref:NAD(P)/FAD-dependent oxidoreductase n=1 Tax=unclassified Streptomyces TaxID=2593676 RepID=UPI0036B03BD1
MYDVIVVGARCAGSPLAMLLARSGLRVVVLDRAAFPRDTVSTHYIQPSGLARLARWGLLDRLTATGCPPVTEALWWFGDTAVRGFAPPDGAIGFALAPRRTVLDALLVDAAREAGAEVRERCTVRSLLRSDDGTVTGVRYQSEGGPPRTLRAPVVVGADGRDSTVARLAGAPAYHARPPLTVVYYTYWRGLPAGRRHRNEVFLEGDKQIGVIPTHDDAYLVQAARPRDFFPTYRSDIERHYLKAVEEAAPSLAAELAGAERVERFRGSAALDNFYRRPYGPGWALVGDAGYHKDPLTGQGISDAWRDAELLAEAIRAHRSGTADWDTALSAYERARNAASALLYDFTCEAASFEFDPMTRQLVRVLAEHREEADRFFGVIAGTVPAERFFAPDNLLSLLGRLPGDALAELTGTEGTP